MSDDDAYEAADELCRQANALLVDEQAAAALALYAQAAARAPRHATAHARAAQCHLLLNAPAAALRAANTALALAPALDVAHLRRGQALLALRRPRHALAALERGHALRHAPLFSAALRQAKLAVAAQSAAERAAEDAAEQAEAADDALTEAASPTPTTSQTPTTPTTTATDGPTPTTGAPPAHESKFRHDWYQSPTHVTIEVFIKQLDKSEANISLRADSVTVRVPSRAYELHVPLFAAVAPPDCEVKYYGTKLVLKLAKATQAHWPSLGPSNERATPVVINPGSSAAAAAAKPAKLASFEKNWDALEKELVEEEKPEGEEALNALFKQIYRDGSDEQRRAMVKSFQQSGGTTLSTNWDDIGKRELEPEPPEGMEVRKWET